MRDMERNWFHFSFEFLPIRKGRERWWNKALRAFDAFISKIPSHRVQASFYKTLSFGWYKPLKILIQRRKLIAILWILVLMIMLTFCQSLDQSHTEKKMAIIRKFENLNKTKNLSVITKNRIDKKATNFLHWHRNFKRLGPPGAEWQRFEKATCNGWQDSRTNSRTMNRMRESERSYLEMSVRKAEKEKREKVRWANFGTFLIPTLYVTLTDG